MPGHRQEDRDHTRHGAKAPSTPTGESTVPRIQIITRKPNGGALRRLELEVHRGLTWPCLAVRQLAGHGPNGRSRSSTARCWPEADDPVARRQSVVDEYTGALRQPYIAAERGYVDDVINRRHAQGPLAPQPSRCWPPKPRSCPSQARERLPPVSEASPPQLAKRPSRTRSPRRSSRPSLRCPTRPRTGGGRGGSAGAFGLAVQRALVGPATRHAPLTSRPSLTDGGGAAPFFRTLATLRSKPDWRAGASTLPSGPSAHTCSRRDR